MGIVVYVSAELSEITLRLAGEVGESGLARSAGLPGMLAAVDQHAAEVRDAVADLGGDDDRPAVYSLLGYARGFVEAAVGRGWVPLPGGGADWESLRLAGVCQLMTATLGLPRT
jgi:hypothetical protein